MLWLRAALITVLAFCLLFLFSKNLMDAHCFWVRQVVWAILCRSPLGSFRKWAGCGCHHAPGCGPGRQGRRVHPQSRFSLHAHFGFTELTGGSQGTLSRTCKHTLPGSLWVSNLFCSWGHTGTPVSQTGGAEWAQAVWYPPEQNKMLILSCLPDGLFSPTWTRERKEDAIYNSTKAIYFKSLKMLLAHISI